MSIKRIVLGSVIFSSVLLAGCSTNQKIDKLNSDVQVINNKVDTLQYDVGQIKQESDIATAEAIRANQRLDNQVQTYKK